MTSNAHEGGCQCGAVRYAAEGTPKFVANCHCRSCRKATGAAFSTWVGFRDEDVRWTGDKPSFHASSPGVKRGFCRRCGAPLSYASDKWPGETHFLIGTFDDESPFTPRRDVFTEDALPWALERSRGR